MNKLQVVDYSDRLNAEGKYQLDVSGYSGYGKDKDRIKMSFDISDLTLDQIGALGAFFNATFDDANMSSITGAGIRRLEPEEVTTNETKMIETFGVDTLNDFKYYLTRVLTNSTVTEKFYAWLDEPYVKGDEE